MSDYNLSHLDELEAEGVMLREVAAQFERPAILFSPRTALRNDWPADVCASIQYADPH